MSKSRLADATLAAVAIAVMAGCGQRAHPAAQTPRPAPPAEVSSSIRDGAELTQPMLWQAYVTGIPASDVAVVRFLIDGKVRYLARTVPYVFAGRGSLLLSGTLGPGSHVFAVDVTLTDGHHLTTAAVAVVSATAPGVPRQVLGLGGRTVTSAEVARTAGDGIYHWSLHGNSLAVQVVSDHQWANRNSFWNGTFTRSDPRSHP